MIRITVRLEQPASFGERSSTASHIETLPYAPGSVVRGAVAAAWIRRFGSPQVLGYAPETAAKRLEFENLFEGDVLWGPLLPVGSDLVPTYVSLCKYPKTLACHTFSVDGSLREEVPGGADRSHIEGSTTSVPVTCTCGSPLVQGKGQLKHAVGGVEPGRVRTTSVELDDDETSKEGQLFSRDYLGRGTVLQGVVSASITDFEWLNDQTLWLGARSSVAGMAKIVDVEPVETPPSAHRSISDAGDGAGRRVVVVAVTPVVLIDDFGRCDPFAVSEALISELGLSPGDIEVDPISNGWLRTTLVSGWNVVAGVAKPQEWAIAPGSAFRFTFSQSLSESTVQRALAHLQTRGFGARRNEGYGMVQVNPPKWVVPTADVADAGAAPDVPNVVASPESDRRSETPLAVLFEGRQGDRVASLIRERFEEFVVDRDAVPIVAPRWVRSLKPEQALRLDALLSSVDPSELVNAYRVLRGLATPQADHQTEESQP